MLSKKQLNSLLMRQRDDGETGKCPHTHETEGVVAL